MDETSSLQVLPGRYTPSRGVLHKDPPHENCNLDDTEADIKVATFADIEGLPADTEFCKWCYTGPERQAVEMIWEEGHVPLHERGTSEEPKP